MLAVVVTNSGKSFDLAIANGRLVNSGLDLETAVLASLFLDAPAPDGSLPRRGYWADSLSGDNTGSLLWLLEAEPVTQQTASRAKTYAAEALKWLTDERHVRRVDIESELHGDSIHLGISITLRDRTTVNLGPFRI